MKCLFSDHAELKSMPSVQTARRRGIGSASRIPTMAEAKKQDIVRLSLETGLWPFSCRHGFVECSTSEGHNQGAGSL
jgi:putative acetyltransferase